MGGLITRFALAALESRGFPHDTRLYVSIDTPHRGAYTNVGDQWVAHYLAPASEDAAALAALLDSTANQQFMMMWQNGGTAIESPLRTEFMRELDGVGGYPQLPERIAISCGRGDGVRSIPPSSPLLTWAGGPFAALQVASLPEGSGAAVVAQGYSFLADPNTPPVLTVASPISWEGAPGGQTFYNALADAVVAGIGFGWVGDPLPTARCHAQRARYRPGEVQSFAPVPTRGAEPRPFTTTSVLRGISRI